MVYRYEISIITGIIIGVTDIIPYFGPILGAILTLMIAARNTVVYAVKCGITIAISGDFVKVRFYRLTLLVSHLHASCYYYACITSWRRVAGIVGLLISVPILADIRKGDCSWWEASLKKRRCRYESPYYIKK